MFIRLNDTYIPLTSCVIDLRDPAQAIVRAPGGGKFLFRGESLVALKAVLQVLEEKDKVIDLEKAFKQPDSPPPQVGGPAKLNLPRV